MTEPEKKPLKLHPTETEDVYAIELEFHGRVHLQHLRSAPDRLAQIIRDTLKAGVDNMVDHTDLENYVIVEGGTDGQESEVVEAEGAERDGPGGVRG